MVISGGIQNAPATTKLMRQYNTHIFVEIDPDQYGVIREVQYATSWMRVLSAIPCEVEMQINRLVVIGVAVILLSGAGYYIFVNGSNNLPEDIAYGNGRIEAVQVDISTKIPGWVKKVVVKEGDLVQPGQLLATIDTAELQAQLLRAKAEISSAESMVKASEAAIAQANAQLLLAKQELERASRLVEKGHTSRETYDIRLSNRDVAQATLAAAEADRLSKKRGVDAAKAVAHEIETRIADATLSSPTIGRVLYRLAEPGEVLGSGGKVLTIINLADIYMEFFLPSTQAHRVSLESEARIKLDVVEFAIPAQVSFVAPKSQFTPKQVETLSEREKLMFRIKVRVPQELVLQHIEKVKTGVRGVAYVRLSGDTQSEWPAFLQKLPPDATQTVSQN